MGKTARVRGSLRKLAIQRTRGSTATLAFPCSSQLRPWRSSNTRAADLKRDKASERSMRSARLINNRALAGSTTCPERDGSSKTDQPCFSAARTCSSPRNTSTQGLTETGRRAAASSVGKPSRKRTAGAFRRSRRDGAPKGWSAEAGNDDSQPSDTASRSAGSGNRPSISCADSKGENRQGLASCRRHSKGSDSGAATKVGATARAQPASPPNPIRRPSCKTWRRCRDRPR